MNLQRNYLCDFPLEPTYSKNATLRFLKQLVPTSWAREQIWCTVLISYKHCVTNIMWVQKYFPKIIFLISKVGYLHFCALSVNSTQTTIASRGVWGSRVQISVWWVRFFVVSCNSSRPEHVHTQSSKSLRNNNSNSIIQCYFHRP